MADKGLKYVGANPIKGMSLGSQVGHRLYLGATLVWDKGYSVVCHLTNITTNAPSFVSVNGSLSATLTPTTDYRMQSVAVTMGETDITSTAYDSTNNTITIASVTGDVSITAAAMPYDAEVEYLYGNGVPYIDTGIYGTPNLYTKLIFQSMTIQPRTGIFGIFTTDKSYYLYQGGATPSCWQVGFGAYQTSTYRTDTVKHTFELDNYKALLDGTQIASFSTPFESTTRTIILFKMFKADGTFYDATDIRIYSCKMIRNGVIVRDFIPVRKDGVGYLYDKVSNTLFGNANSSGAFTYGNDKT